jgi:hypothetical protein
MLPALSTDQGGLGLGFGRRSSLVHEVRVLLELKVSSDVSLYASTYRTCSAISSVSSTESDKYTAATYLESAIRATMAETPSHGKIDSV